jgi:hypothetical protein
LIDQCQAQVDGMNNAAERVLDRDVERDGESQDPRKLRGFTSYNTFNQISPERFSGKR